MGTPKRPNLACFYQSRFDPPKPDFFLLKAKPLPEAVIPQIVIEGSLIGIEPGEVPQRLVLFLAPLRLERHQRRAIHQE